MGKTNMGDDLIFKGTVSDMPFVEKEPSELEKQLFDDTHVQRTVDKFEKAIGVKKDNISKITPRIRKNIVLDPEEPKDKTLLNDLLNETSKFNIIKWSENWTRTGKFKVFIIYEEILDTPKKSFKETMEEKSNDE